MNKDIQKYYALRAKEYESVYKKPERQQDLKAIKEYLSSAFEGKTVYEIACGTGYWTQFISRAAKKIYATDINDEVIKIAQTKSYGSNILFQQADMYTHKTEEKCNACFGGFIWSHILNQNLEAWLDSIHRSVSKLGLCIFIDNQFVEGSNTPVSHRDDQGNTYQRRFLKNGSEHSVLKNFPTDAEFHKILANKATNVQIRRLEYFWILSYQLLDS